MIAFRECSGQWGLSLSVVIKCLAMEMEKE